MTHREFLVRMAWIENDMERPSREDWYLMQIAAEILRDRVKDPSKVKLEDMRLRFANPNPPPVTRQEAADKSRSRWCGMLGVKQHG